MNLLLSFILVILAFIEIAECAYTNRDDLFGIPPARKFESEYCRYDQYKNIICTKVPNKSQNIYNGIIGYNSIHRKINPISYKTINYNQFQRRSKYIPNPRSYGKNVINSNQPYYPNQPAPGNYQNQPQYGSTALGHGQAQSVYIQPNQPGYNQVQPQYGQVQPPYAQVQPDYVQVQVPVGYTQVKPAFGIGKPASYVKIKPAYDKVQLEYVQKKPDNDYIVLDSHSHFDNRDSYEDLFDDYTIVTEF